MNKRLYLPIIASTLILAMVLSSVMPAMAAVALRARAEPTVEVTTISEDDEVRKTGIIVLGLTPKGPWDKPKQTGVDKLSQHKILVTYNGEPITFTLPYGCQLIKKEKLHPLQKPQGTYEQLRTVLTDESANFKCKLRSIAPGVGVLDIYYTGSQAKQFVADYVVIIIVRAKIGNMYVYGTDMQDICVLGWSMGSNHLSITKPDGTHHHTWDDPLGPFVGCEEASLWQRDALGLPLLYD